MKRLTHRQREVLQFIIDEVVEHGVAPTIDEIHAEFPVIKHRSLVGRVLDALESKRYIKRVRSKKRGVIVVRGPDQPRHIHLKCSA